MKKVGILTLYYKTYNFGAQLQAYSLQRIIEKLGYECEQIRYKWCKEETIKGYEFASIDQEKFMKFSLSIPHSNKVYASDTIHNCIDEYDIFVCGSDQIWGVEHSMPIYKLPIMAMSFVPDNKVKISYAASLGGVVASDKIEEILKKTLNKIDAISVREKSAASYIESISERKVKSVLDPVMLLEKEELEELAGENDNRAPYILYYTIGLDYKLDILVNEISKRKKLEIVKIGYSNGMKIGPEDFVKLIRDANYIVTDSFHATVLSIIFNKQFLVTPIDKVQTKRSRNFRILDLLDNFDLKKRFMLLEEWENKDIDKLYDILDETINYEEVKRKLIDLRSKSINFLINNLNIEKKKTEFLKSKDKCTGCGICSIKCPNGCISMERDEFGFMYPLIDKKKCIECGICRKACNNINQIGDSKIGVVAIMSKDECVREKSSSGGIFYEIARGILGEGGVVVACTFTNEFKVEHRICRNIEEIDRFCKSKYVQSNAYEVFCDIENEIKKQKKVLFVGTPCQVYALVSYIGEIPENLYLVDLVCGGVTSPELWDRYLEEKQVKGKIIDINTRYKYGEYLTCEGFPAYAMKLTYSEHEEIRQSDEDLFLSTRFSFYRECCYDCKYKGVDRISDITIGDFCGMKSLVPEMYDGKGVTLSIVHTQKGKELLTNTMGMLKQNSVENIGIEKILEKNIMICGQMNKKPQYEYLKTIYSNSSIERLYYENKMIDEIIRSEYIERNFYLETVRNELQMKLMKFHHCRLIIEECPLVVGDVYIYGAGKLGRAMLSCMKNEPEGFIDGNPMLKNCMGIDVYHLGTEEMKNKLNDGNNKTVIITPIWDYDIISEELLHEFPRLNIVSLKKVVGDVWL